jgi:hypothetical protein
VSEKVVGYKGFDKDFKCRDMQYEVAKTYETDNFRLCHSGFHFCTDPLDVLKYYWSGDGSRFATVECERVSDTTDSDSKRVCGKITVIKEISLDELITAASSGDSSRAASSGDSSRAASSGDSSTAASSGDSSTAASSGDYSRAASSGDSSRAASSGNYSTAASSGDSSRASCDTNGFACVAGIIGNAKGGKGSAISLGYLDKSGHNRIAVGYPGENLKIDQWYKVDNEGNFVEVSE